MGGPNAVDSSSQAAQTIVQKTAGKRTALVAGVLLGATVAGARVSRRNKGRLGNRRLVHDSFPHGTRPVAQTDGCVPYMRNKYGFIAGAVWKRPSCRRLQCRCNRGSGNACRKYLKRCQINGA